MRCFSCGELFAAGSFAIDRSKAGGRKSICLSCDRKRSRVYYEANRELLLAAAKLRRPGRLVAECSECGGLLEGRRRVVCSGRCKDARFRRLNPEAWAERERRKVEWRRERRREGGS